MKKNPNKLFQLNFMKGGQDAMETPQETEWPTEAPEPAQASSATQAAKTATATTST